MTDTPRVPGRVYQASCDPERVQIEERAKALSEAGYPLPEDDPAMHAEQRLKEAKQAAHATVMSQVNTRRRCYLQGRCARYCAKSSSDASRLLIRVSSLGMTSTPVILQCRLGAGG